MTKNDIHPIKKGVDKIARFYQQACKQISGRVEVKGDEDTDSDEKDGNGKTRIRLRDDIPVIAYFRRQGHP